jgi:phytoene dehydrogenase-like protein
MPYDAIIIGGGHNGLVAAAYLARAGRRVAVFERRSMLGGAAVTEEVFPGFKFSVCSYVVSLLRPEIIRELDLRRHGLEILPLNGTFTPMDGDYLWRPEDHAELRRQIARHSQKDAAQYEPYEQMMVRMAQVVKPILAMTPPDPSSIDTRAIFDTLGLAKRFRELTHEEQHVFVQLMTASAVDFVERWFESDVLKATLAASGIIGTYLGVRSPGTAYVLLHHYMGELDGAFRAWGLPRGGMGAVSNAIASAARAAGATLTTDAPVTRVLVRDGRAHGVVLANGDEHHAPIVVSGADLRVTFERLVGLNHVPAEFAEAVRHFRFRGATAKVNLALDALPDFLRRPDNYGHLRGAISISPSLDYMERAYDEAKYGWYSSRPYLDIVIPSLTDPSIAPPGKHVMSCFVQYAPYRLRSSAWDTEREHLGDAVINAIAEFAPNIRGRILHRQVVTPLDLERDFSLTEGNIFHGELTPDQLFSFRPVPGWARYRTPIQGLYLCGSSAHPGGGVMGAPGRNAAREILKDTTRGWRKKAPH